MVIAFPPLLKKKKFWLIAWFHQTIESERHLHQNVKNSINQHTQHDIQQQNTKNLLIISCSYATPKQHNVAYSTLLSTQELV